MRQRAASMSYAAGLLLLPSLGTAACAVPGPADGAESTRMSLRISNSDGELATIVLNGDRFAVSYRNSLYGSWAEERYVASADGSYALVQIAADEMAVLEEYYALPTAPRPAEPADRRNWVAEPDSARQTTFTDISLAATDLGQRTVHVPGSAPLALWTLVENDRPYVVLTLEETE